MRKFCVIHAVTTHLGDHRLALVSRVGEATALTDAGTEQFITAFTGERIASSRVQSRPSAFFFRHRPYETRNERTTTAMTAVRLPFARHNGVERNWRRKIGRR
jgi:hypothetical protein